MFSSLPSAEQELYSELQGWACDIFATKKKKRKTAQSAPETASAWPGPEQPTGQLARLLDVDASAGGSGAGRRRVTHAMRAGICSTLCREQPAAGGAAPEPPDALRKRAQLRRHATQLANVAVLTHAPTAVLRELVAAMRRSVVLWAAVLLQGVFRGRMLVEAPVALLESCARDAGLVVAELDRWLWQRWVSAPQDDIVCGAVVADASSRAAASASQSGLAADGALGEFLTGMDTLRPYQLQALRAVEAASPSNCCAVLPCGAGKTKLGAAIAHNFLEVDPAACVLVLCLRTEGIRQWSAELEAKWDIKAFQADGSVTLARVQALHRAQVILVTYARMLSEQRQAALAHAPGGLLASRFVAAPQGLLLADECHMVPARKIGGLLEALLSTGKERRLVGLTGTLLREGGVGIDAATDATDGNGGEVPWPLLGKCVHRENFAQLAPQYLAPVRCIEVRVPTTGRWQKLFADRPLASAVCLSRGKFEVLEHLLAKHAQDSLLITVERCEQARLIASTFGIIPLDGSISNEQMQDYLDRFRKRRILALVATHVLDDSADFPELTVMIQIGGFFASRRQEQQRLGRLLRWGPIKRRFWEEVGARPIFYVLVHEGTIEERMRQHRTSSVIGIDYERFPAQSLTAPPESLLDVSTLFKPTGRSRGTSFNTGAVDPYVDSAEALARTMEDEVFRLATRLASNLPGGKRLKIKDRRALVASVRGWLHGSRGAEAIDDASGHDSQGDLVSEALSSDAEGTSSSSSSSSSSTSSASTADGSADSDNRAAENGTADNGGIRGDPAARGRATEHEPSRSQGSELPSSGDVASGKAGSVPLASGALACMPAKGSAAAHVGLADAPPSTFARLLGPGCGFMIDLDD